MGRVERQVTKETVVAIGFDERQCVVGQVVADKSATAHEPAVLLERGVEIISPMARAESVELVKTPGVGVIRILRSVVPLAERPHRIARALEGVCRWSSHRGRAVHRRLSRSTPHPADDTAP